MQIFFIKAGIWLLVTSFVWGMIWFVASASLKAALVLCIAAISILIWHLVGYEISEKKLDS